MRKTYNFIFKTAAASVLVLVAAACSKEEIAGTFPEEGEEVELNFTATTPGMAVKTVLGDETGHRSISWSGSDTVKVIYGTSYTSYKEAGVSRTGEIGIRVQTSSYRNFFSVYPSTLVSSMTSSSPAKGQLTIPAVQNGKFEDAGIMAAWAGTDRLLRFHTAASIIAVDIKDKDVTQFVVRSNDGQPVAGQVALTFDTETGDITSAVAGSTTYSEVTVNVDGAGRYYVALLPDVDLKAGIGFKIMKGDSAEGALSRTPLKLSSTELRVIGQVDDKVLTGGDIYIKDGGMGKGTSWTDAADVNLLKKLLNAYVSEGVTMDGTTIAWRLAGRKVYVAKGSYTLSTEDAPFCLGAGTSSLELTGGFYEGSTGTDISQYNPESWPTVFTAGKGARIVNVVGAEGGKVSLKGITFSGADTKSDGAALLFGSAGATLSLKDCSFSSNSTTADGAGLCVTAGTVSIDSCVFSQNQGTGTITASTKEDDTMYSAASNGGAIFAVGTATDLYIKGCTFNGNLAFTGADIEAHNGADVFAYDCCFKGATSSAANYLGIYPGRIVNADAMKGGAIGRFCAYNCTFTKSSSVYQNGGTSGLPLVAPTNYFCLLASCTLHDGAVAGLRNNNQTSRTTTDPNLIWVINNFFYNTSGNDINLATSSTRHGMYNVIEKGKNAYATLDATDTSIPDQDFIDKGKIEWKDSYYKWSIDETVHPVNRPTRAFVIDWVKAACPDFDAWLTLLGDNPYGTDQNGTVRNPGAMTPGAWDKGL